MVNAPQKGSAGDGQQPTGGNGSSPVLRSNPELIVVAKSGVGLRATADGVSSAAGLDIAPLVRTLESENILLKPLFGASEERLQAEAASQAAVRAGAPPGLSVYYPDLSVYYYVEAPMERLDQLAEQLRTHSEFIEGVYVKPPAEPPYVLNDMQPLAADAPATSPDFTSRQGYLDAAPGGIDARYAWTLSGGRGTGARIIDCEWGWRFTHEDLLQNQGGVVAGTPSTDTNHGTAVVGEIGGDHNGFGIAGISPDAFVSAVSFNTLPSATAIRQAADRLGPGDIILLEIHRPGPRATGIGQQGFIAIEWWPDDFDAIRYAVNKGIIVVEAAGNGAQNLDDPVYNTPVQGFPATWTNPFNRANRDSGAVVVGAGAPPPGTHGADWGPDRSRLDFSNYGSVVDAQGWGREVTSTGYGDLQGGSTTPDLWYTDTFSGTSSASPIVVGALACVQGVLRAQGRIALNPARARELLRATGSAQQDAPGRPATQRIGNRPNLRQLIASATQTASWTGVQFTGTVPAGQTKCWFTFNWPAHWHVVWTVVPTSLTPGGPQIKWRVKVERASDSFITYWICISNVSSVAVNIETRFAVLGW